MDRAVDPILAGERGGAYRYVHPDSIIPLCSRHHLEYDARQLDLLPYLYVHEQSRACEDAEGFISALKRISPMGGTW